MISLINTQDLQGQINHQIVLLPKKIAYNCQHYRDPKTLSLVLRRVIDLCNVLMTCDIHIIGCHVCLTFVVQNSNDHYIAMKHDKHGKEYASNKDENSAGSSVQSEASNSSAA